eukprot:TRINITY_DN113838_c0_g1_i1.p1 TRINITY_DN113838_c0_g1~~TRINITY_DN113838_c0_g1_i1.p1  ORF type:complete len:342 (-),score=54.82 TRINITY_DN113838_c0_g1_i1:484-1434(-)
MAEAASKTGKIKTKASKGPVRLTEEPHGQIVRQPGVQGNDFDVRMAEEGDGLVAAKKIVTRLREQGACLVEANAPPELVVAAHEEAEQLWEDGAFTPPLRIECDRTLLEAKLWQHSLGDERSVVWFTPSQNDQKSYQMNALKLLAKNMTDFATGLSPLLQDRSLEFDRFSKVMLSCYTGDRTYHLHVDNPHAGGDSNLPDNGLRLTMVYYINTHWDPDADDLGAGGLDILLAGAEEPPTDAGAIKSAPRLRIAPHADTMALFLSQRMAHQGIATKGTERWYCLTLWGIHSTSMQGLTRKLAEMGRQSADADSDDDA